MDSRAANKRLKGASGAPMVAQGHGGEGRRSADGLPAYRPPPAAVASHSSPSGRSQDLGAANSARSTATISRQGDGNKLRLTVKAPPSKLRQATSGSRFISDSDDPSESDATPRPVQRSVRSTRNTRTLVDPDSDELEAMADQDEAAYQAQERSQKGVIRQVDSDIDADGDDDGMDDAEGEEEVDEEEEEEEEEEENSDQGEDDGDGEEEEEEDDDDDDEDELQSEMHPPPPIIRRDNKGKTIVQSSVPSVPLKSVEDKEMEDAAEEDDDDDDEELSELDSNEDDVEGMRDVDEMEEDDAEGSDEDDENSRSATPDLSKLTRRQRGAFEDDMDGSLLALSNEAQKKKVFTEEEHAVRRQEMARRRKNLSEKRNEEEKMETINKLLKKPAPKRRTRAEILAAQRAIEMGGTPGVDEDGEEQPPHPAFVRWVTDTSGSRVGLPTPWLQSASGAVFGRDPNDEDTITVSSRATTSHRGLMVEEVS